MHLDRYPVITGKDSLVFDFVSEGKFGKVEKMVIYSQTGIPGLYNIGFGDKNKYAGDFDDVVVTNNGDSRKVLATVANTLYTFTEQYPNAIIFARGATLARTRLYRMGISNNYELINEDFDILGFRKGNWYPFQKNVEFDQFLAKRKILKGNVRNLVLMQSNQNNYKGSFIIGVDPELDKYVHHPYFVKKAEEAEEIIRRVGLPEEWKDQYPIPPRDAEKK